ncbi:MAG: prepilin-type N-terminal cleavage/methylation domain-containing protein, partial [Bacilli bacterium]|nr:prepilin-type N-terminal cleavage/methylation domain-containing protein [Bacilli bacterium]
MNKKGFTLIEALAVIIILALISVIAIPSVTRLIENTKRQS